MEIIIPYQNSSSYRERNLKHVLEYYLRSEKVSKVILVEQETESDIHTHPKLEHMQVKIDKNNFCRGALINDGYTYIKSDIIGIVDGDCLIDLNIDISTAMKECDIFYPFDNINFLSEGHTRQLIRKGTYTQYKPHTKMHVNRYNGGAVFIKKDCFLKVDGYDENIKGWGREDDVFLAMAKRLNFKIDRDTNTFMTHLYHPSSATDVYKASDRFKENSEILALVKRMSNADFDTYMSDTEAQPILLDLYRDTGKLNIITRILCGHAELCIDSTIYEIIPDENGNIGLKELFDAAYREDGIETLQYAIDLVEKTCQTFTKEEQEIIEEYKRTCTFYNVYSSDTPDE